MIQLFWAMVWVVLACVSLSAYEVFNQDWKQHRHPLFYLASCAAWMSLLWCGHQYWASFLAMMSR